jgi:hypothetical protein
LVNDVIYVDARTIIEFEEWATRDGS